MGTGGLSITVGVAACAAWSVALAANDIRVRRLPDPLTVPPALVAVVACGWHPAWCWGLIWPVLYLVYGDGIGGGDVKLAISLGVACAAAGGLVSTIAAVGVAGAMTAVAALCTGRRSLPHGPSMLCAAWMVVVCWGMYSGV